jgi:thiamine kinase-like enzyme
LFWKEKFAQGYLSQPDLLAEAACLKSRLAGADCPLVFCHNDALLANIVHQQDKDRVGNILLIRLKQL